MERGICSMSYKGNKFLCCLNVQNQFQFIFSYVLSRLATQVFQAYTSQSISRYMKYRTSCPHQTLDLYEDRNTNKMQQLDVYY